MRGEGATGYELALLYVFTYGELAGKGHGGGDLPLGVSQVMRAWRRKSVQLFFRGRVEVGTWWQRAR